MSDLSMRFADLATQFVTSSETATKLEKLAADFRDAGRHLAAAQAALAGHHAAWGVEPHELCPRLLEDGLNDLIRHLQQPPDDWSTALALSLLIQKSASPLWRASPALAEVRLTALVEYDALIRRLAKDQLESGALLVSGFRLQGFLDEYWEPAYPGFEVTGGASRRPNDGSRPWIYDMNSAFRCALEMADYDGAVRLAEERDEALITPPLRGWAMGSRAILAPDPATFSDAAEQFFLDAPDRPGRKEPSWTGINQQLWGPYFQARGHVASPFGNVAEALNNLQRAGNILPVGGGFRSIEATRYFSVIRALLALSDGNIGALDAAMTDYAMDRRFMAISTIDQHVEQFLRSAKALLEHGLNEQWIRRLTEIMMLLDRVPVLCDQERRTLETALNAIVPGALLGVGRGWEHRALSAIKDERQLHRILLKLFQAEAKTPLYAHVRHGPFEYGKDLVVCRVQDGKAVLFMYSAKIGTINKADWNTDVRPQLEEIFQIEFSSAEIPFAVDERVGVLVWNDHLQPHVEPIVSAWVSDQRKVFGRRYELVHIDALVKYVHENRLQSPLRQALRDEGLLS